MANIKFSQFTNQAAADTTYLVGFDGTDNTNYTKAQIKTWLTSGSNAIPTLYSENGTLAGNRTITMNGNTLSMSSPGGNTVTFDGANNSGMAITGGNNYIVSFNGTYAISSIATSTSDAIVLRTSANASADTSILIDSRSPGANADLHLKTATKLKIDLPVAATVGYVLKADDVDGNVSWAAETDTDTGITGVTLAVGTGQTLPLAESITNRELTLTSNKYGGTNQVGYVPEGGTNTTFLRGDGTWVTPTDTNTNIANTDLNLDASRTLGLGASQNLTFTGSGTSKVTFSNTGGVQFDEDVTFVKNSIIQGQAYTELNSLSNTLTINWNDSNVQAISGLTGSHTFTPTNPKAGATYILTLTQTGAVTATWGSYIRWAAPDSAATPPTLSGSGKTDVITLICWSATANSGAGGYYGSITKDLS